MKCENFGVFPFVSLDMELAVQVKWPQLLTIVFAVWAWPIMLELEVNFNFTYSFLNI